MSREIRNKIFNLIEGAGQSSGGWSSYWKNQDEVLFFAETENIADGKLYNQKIGANDYLTVGGSAGSYTFQCPDTAPYIAADTDYIWFKTDASQRTPTEAELIGYDLQRTPVKYDDDAPNSIRAIMILSSAVTGATLDRLHRDMDLPLFWAGLPNINGVIKSNRGLAQQLWTPEAVLDDDLVTYISGLTTPLSAGQLTNLDTFIKGIKDDLSITDLSDAFDTMLYLGNETSESSLRNMVAREFDATLINTPTHTPLEGYAGNGTDEAIDLVFHATNDATRFLQNSSSFGFYCRTDNSENKGDFSDAANRIRLIVKNALNQTVVRIFRTSSTVIAGTTDARGMFIVSRTGENAFSVYQNGVSIGDFTDASTSGATGLKALFVDGSYSTKQGSFVFCGKGLNPTEVAAITTRIEALMDANGKGVIA